MITRSIAHITDCIGSETERYFSQGFKFIDYRYQNLSYNNCMFKGNISVINSWDKRKPKHLHLGTMEFMAIASNICENILHQEYYLNKYDISHSWISDFKIKITKCINLKESEVIPLSGELVSTIKEVKTELFKSTINITVRDTKLTISIVHPIYLRKGQSNSNNIIGFNNNYKLRDHDIKDIHVCEDFLSCSAHIQVNNCTRGLGGLESSFQGPLITDIIKISGQLMEVLIYNMPDKTSKENIWLKEFKVTNRSPEKKQSTDASISFNQIRDLIRRGEVWRSINFTSKIGSMDSEIKVVTKL